MTQINNLRHGECKSAKCGFKTQNKSELLMHTQKFGHIAEYVLAPEVSN